MSAGFAGPSSLSQLSPSPGLCTAKTPTRQPGALPGLSKGTPSCFNQMYGAGQGMDESGGSKAQQLFALTAFSHQLQESLGKRTW